MKKIVFWVVAFFLAGCGENDLKRPNPSNNQNNQTCVGDAPLADRQEGVCAGELKVCVQINGAWNWAEPDYAAIEGYETEEVSCDGLDNDCDGTVDEGLRSVFYRDADGDGYGDLAQSVEACTAPSGHVTDHTDCDDTSAERFPGNLEVCDGLDNDCNGQIDEGLQSNFYRDADGDGYGDAADSVTACMAPSGYVSDNTDCDDASVARHPGNLEVCDGLDNDCDGFVDEGVRLTFYRDADGDGHGIAADSVLACAPPAGYVAIDDDCDDENAARFPGNPEVCDGIDNDCDGFVDEGVLGMFYQDVDGDGYGNPGESVQACTAPSGYVSDNTDCNDTNASVNPGRAEVCNGIDDNCNGAVDEGVLNTYYRDADSDGYGNPSVTTQVCTAPSGYVSDNTDCDDANASVNPGRAEVCNGIDDDCDGSVDEGVQMRYYRDADGDGVGSSTDFVWACSRPAGYVMISGDCNDSDTTMYPGNFEVCDLKDNDCNGLVDEGVQMPYYRDADGDGYGNPLDAVYACTAPLGYVDNDEDCNDASSQAYPGGMEICDGLDNDCNGTVDVDPELGGTKYYQDFDGDTYGNPASFKWACSALSGYVLDNTDCNDFNPLVNSGALEICDGMDNDCNGSVDAGASCPTNAHCEDEGRTVPAYCACDAGYIEDPGTHACVQGRWAQTGDLLITEIMIQPSVGDSGQYFEIRNQAALHVAINGVRVDVEGATLSFAPSPLFLLAPGAHLLVARTVDPGENGGIAPDVVFASMPVLSTAAGEIEIYIPGTPDTVLDAVAWDATWRHAANRSLELSPGVISQAGAMALNDNRLSWCSGKTLYNAASRGTPKTANDNCLVDSCRLLDPTIQHITVGQNTAFLNAQVYAQGVTEPAGQGADVSVQLGYGPFRSSPTLPSWTWVAAAYYGDSTPYDLYRNRLTPTLDGTYSYAFRVTFDGGYTWRYCDKQGNDVYDPLQGGGLLVDAPCTPGGTQCSDCIDNDGDGLIDGWDPECIKASDDIENAFSTGSTADDNGKQILDCWYDGNAGGGDDGCETHACCLLDAGTCAWMESYYGLPNNSLTKFWPYTCPTTQPSLCLTKCLPATPPGCDCFGCCTVCSGSDCRTILIGVPGTFSQCNQNTILDPIKCPSCTMDPSCARPCDPDNCELCPGMTELDLPPHCTSYACSGGLQSCSSTSECPVGYTCITGCCTKDFASN